MAELPRLSTYLAQDRRLDLARGPALRDHAAARVLHAESLGASMNGGAINNLGTVSVVTATMADTSAARGGTINNDGTAASRLTISDSTLRGNDAFQDTAVRSTSQLEIENTTLGASTGVYTTSQGLYVPGIHC